MGTYTVTSDAYRQMIAHCLDAYPLEGCGLLAGSPGESTAVRCFPTANAAASARVYTVDPKDHLRADRAADEQALEINAVFHSHTHTEAYPSPTDVGQAPVSEWHYLVVSLQHSEPEARVFRIVDGEITEQELVVAAD